MLPSNDELTTAARIIAQSRRVLPNGYKLGDDDVFCGRGSLGVTHIGNRKFRDIVMANSDRYINATSKFERSIIIYEVVDHIRSKSPHGGFVKNDSNTGCLYEIGDLAAREKASQAFRDATQGKYKSSRMTKARNRMTDKLRKACERFGSSMASPSPTIPVTTQKCNVHNISRGLSSSSLSEKRIEQKNCNTNEHEYHPTNNHQISTSSDLEVVSSFWSKSSNSDPFDFTSSKNDCISDFSSNYDKCHSNISLQEFKVDASACDSTTTVACNHIVMPDANNLDAITFDLLLKLVYQNTFTNPSQESFEPRPIK